MAYLPKGLPKFGVLPKKDTDKNSKTPGQTNYKLIRDNEDHTNAHTLNNEYFACVLLCNI